VTLQTLMNKPVRTADGKRVGRIHDFGARWDGETILVTHLRVGASAWIERLRPPGALRWLFQLTPGMDLPWEAIDAVDREVRLKPGWDRARCEECRPKPGDAG
jgi:sporulation protein YlmC with PRC-barrel domain